MPSLQESYAPLQKKFGLPSYEDLNAEFELLYIANLSAIDFPLRFVRRRVIDKLTSVCNFLQANLQPNPSSLVNVREAAFYSKEEKEKMFALLKECMHMNRLSFHLEVETNDKLEAAFIKDALKCWKKVKPSYEKWLKLLATGWTKKEEKKKEQESYFN